MPMTPASYRSRSSCSAFETAPKSRCESVPRRRFDERASVGQHQALLLAGCAHHLECQGQPGRLGGHDAVLQLVARFLQKRDRLLASLAIRSAAVSNRLAERSLQRAGRQRVRVRRKQRALALVRRAAVRGKLGAVEKALGRRIEPAKKRR